MLARTGKGPRSVCNGIVMQFTSNSLPPFRSMISLRILTSLLLALTVVSVKADHFSENIEPFVQKYCHRCHNDKETKGDLDFTRSQNDGDVVSQFRRWKNISVFISSGEMPPKDQLQPEIQESNAVLHSIENIMTEAARKHAGDPGIILSRRLSNTEYDLSVLDLTGVNIRPTRDFPPDPAGGEGFDNTGETLSMSPNLLNKYLGAAQEVANHMILRTDGIAFVPHQTISYNERKKYAESAIIEFYRQRQVDISAYVDAAWRYRDRRDNQRSVTIQDWAAERNLSGKYLSRVWDTLSESPQSTGFLRHIGALWEAVPKPKNDQDRPPQLSELTLGIEYGVRTLCPPLKPLIKSNAGNWPIQWLSKRTEIAAARDIYAAENLRDNALLNLGRIRKPEPGQSSPYSIYVRFDNDYSDRDGYVIVQGALISRGDKPPANEQQEKDHEVESLYSVLLQHAPMFADSLQFGKHPDGSELERDWFVVKSPRVLEIPVSVSMQQKFAGLNILLPCYLDIKNSADASVTIQHATDKLPRIRFTTKSQQLLFSQGAAAKELAASGAKFCDTFPNRFFYVDPNRGLAAGFHLVEGFFRDDQPLMQKVLTDPEIAQIDALWQELDFVTESTETLLRGFVWFERSERHVLHDRKFDFLRSEDPLLVTDAMLTKFERIYLEKLGTPAKPGSLEEQRRELEPEKPSERFDMVHGFFQSIRRGLEKQKSLLKQAEPRGLADVLVFAQRAFCRELSETQSIQLRSLYADLRNSGQSIEDSLRGLVVAVLMSPDFCYRFNDTPQGKKIYALDNMDLATRLSYFLWSTLPDPALLSIAKKRDLTRGNEMSVQTRRMIRDPRIEAFAREFFGQWLRFRDYLENDPINPLRFTDYTEEVRQAMWEEPVRFAVHLIQSDRPITELIDSDSTFVNGVLANHYAGGIQQSYRTAVDNFKEELRVTNTPLPDAQTLASQWFQVAGLHEAGRGGVFGMGVFLANNSSGERTSPVKRGFWTVHHLLGQHFPPPPADVPDLPEKESETKLTIRELLNEHVSDSQCALCHKHFDYLGLTMEGFDPIGRFRSLDLAGRPVDNLVTLPGGETAKGIPGLIRYITENRKQEFVQTMCRKFVGYALGRSVELSDQPLLDQMEKQLEQNNYRFSIMFDLMVNSSQFRKIRGRSFVEEKR